jgi:glucan-binding YG repeat protein
MLGTIMRKLYKTGRFLLNSQAMESDSDGSVSFGSDDMMDDEALFGPGSGVIGTPSQHPAGGSGDAVSVHEAEAEAAQQQARAQLDAMFATDNAADEEEPEPADETPDPDPQPEPSSAAVQETETQQQEEQEPVASVDDDFDNDDVDVDGGGSGGSGGEQLDPADFGASEPTRHTDARHFLQTKILLLNLF